jgi:hypothetical protein
MIITVKIIMLVLLNHVIPMKAVNNKLYFLMIKIFELQIIVIKNLVATMKIFQNPVMIIVNVLKMDVILIVDVGIMKLSVMITTIVRMMVVIDRLDVLMMK